MALETGGKFNPADTNNLGYTGLIQMGEDAAKEAGTATEALRKMGPVEQLDYVYNHFKKYTGKLNTLTDFYLSVLMPVDVGKGNQPDAVVFDAEFPLEYNKNGKMTNLSKSRHFGYRCNPPFFQEKGELDAWIKGGKAKGYEDAGKTYVWEIAKTVKEWYGRGVPKMNGCTCGVAQTKPEQKLDDDSVLEQMKKIADKHIPYSQDGERVADTDEGWLNLDCSELIYRYLVKLGVVKKFAGLDTSVMTTEADFRKAIGSDNIVYVGDTPQRGDIFVWRTGGKGHTGIVYKVDGTQLTILEAIGDSGSCNEKYNKQNNGYPERGCSRTAVYESGCKSLNGHPGWKGYFRPTNYTKKL